LDKYLVVLAGAGLGGLARYVAGTWIMAKYGGRFPLGTFVINITGAFLIGVLMTLLTERFHPHPNWRLFLVVGILGGYTTFSSFEYETYQAVRDGERWLGLVVRHGQRGARVCRAYGWARFWRVAAGNGRPTGVLAHPRSGMLTKGSRQESHHLHQRRHPASHDGAARFHHDLPDAQGRLRRHRYAGLLRLRARTN
jgi:fluoride exporter